jgi:hypothetical protein
MRIFVRTSRWAIWARRLGSLALPLALIPILMHRSRAISTETFEVIEVVAIAVAVLTVCCCAAAFVRIWITGDHGWWRTLSGLFFALLCLAPLGLLGADYLLYPVADEVSTDAANPPNLLSGRTPPPATPAQAAAIAKAFPNLTPRHYPLPAPQVFELIDKLASDRSWDVQRRRVPVGTSGEGLLSATATSLLGFRDEIAVRIAPQSDGGSSVDMRSASLTRLHEAGANGSRTQEFLSALDAKVTLLMKTQPAGTADDTDAYQTDQSGLAPVVPAPPPRERK